MPCLPRTTRARLSGLFRQSLLASTLCLGLGSNPSLAGLIHVVDTSGNLATVETDTGNVNLIGNTGVALTDIGFDNLGQLYGISATDLYLIDEFTAATTLIGAHGIAGANALVAFKSAIYTASSLSTSIFSLDKTTATATDIGDVGFASGGEIVIIDSELYLLTTTNQLVDTILFDGVQIVYGPANELILGLVAGGLDVGFTAITSDTIYGSVGFGFPNPDSFDLFLPVSYTGQGLGQIIGQTARTEFEGNIPEPGSLALAGLGLLGLAVLRRKT